MNVFNRNNCLSVQLICIEKNECKRFIENCNEQYLFITININKSRYIKYI